MAETIIEWDGRNVPAGLRDLAPGRYVVAALDEVLSGEEEAAVLEGLADLEAGRVASFEEVMRDLRSRARPR
jgi:predicted transcriptional regulator